MGDDDAQDDDGGVEWRTETNTTALPADRPATSSPAPSPAPPPATEDLDEPCFPCPRRNTLRASTDTFVGASSPNPQPGFEIVLTEGGMGFGEIDAGPGDGRVTAYLGRLDNES